MQPYFHLKLIQAKNVLPMKIYRIIKVSKGWSTNKLRRDVESLINEISNDGHNIVTVSFGKNVLLMPTAYITFYQNS